MNPVIEYDSFQTKNKKPFGAVLHGTEIQFAISIHNLDVVQISLQVDQDGHWDTEKSVQMTPSGDDQNRFVGAFRPNISGLYFYYFKIQTDTATLYYGCVNGGFGGPGTVYQNRAQVQMYQITCLAEVETIPEWYQNAVFYHIFVDRFSNGNPDDQVNQPKANSFIYGRKTDLPVYIRNSQNDILRWDFYGGNLKGIEQKLPYLADLGVTALYLSPIFEARSNHRYDTGDYFKIDGILGTLADFDHLLSKIHQMGMHVVLDGVFNHVGADSKYFNLWKSYENDGAVQSVNSPYYSWFDFLKYPTDYKSWWGIKDLPTINKDEVSYQNYIYGNDDSVLNYWTSRGVDGWRLDVADELPDSFIGGIRKAVSQYPERVVIGEVWEDASHKVAYNQRRHYLEGGMLQATMNYPLRELIINTLNRKIKPRGWWRRLGTLQENYPQTAFNNALNNIGTHDTERILTAVGNDKTLLLNAMWLLFSLPGTPCLYYADETGMLGGTDPENRAFYPWGHEDQEILSEVKKAIIWRKHHNWINKAQFTPFYIEDTVIGLRYQSEDNQLSVLLNVTESDQDVELADVIGIDGSTIIRDGKSVISFKKRQMLMF
ncbi:glycoside hydrolase family 13 protein [Pediococcus claussenii]|uniref:Alpha amylase, catalytic domain protein n=1 Tax=Pediococcus claussenii (strain ATCC BAA-344 / DSM 14800 / JCM 18046 / KCTC 3811 / LMG 21948 / P06) TaxID=701521 RepID=G8PAM8_PEDCP|nr:glycoside hydrolase family 13 protein [Pediococcus claussenii]AEV94587.1 alpha amylase, catalytic domain protein [Pediococcus claussenii ATCC BAA-344]ANZ69797.1 alpha-glycosidase [Pediococcus claussenii]ANZ71614.1 alpha-glycosidase [Pediococcus claussenii]